MVFKSKISPEKRALAILLRKESGLSFPKTAEKCKISTSSAERICKGGFCQSREKQITSKKTGRPRKISPRVARMLQRNLLKMRNEGLAVTVKKLVEYSGLSLQTASVHTYSRYLNDLGFFFLQARKKGLLTEKTKNFVFNLQERWNVTRKRMHTFGQTKLPSIWMVYLSFTSVTPRVLQWLLKHGYGAERVKGCK